MLTIPTTRLPDRSHPALTNGDRAAGPLHWLFRAGRSVWLSLERTGQERARRELRRLADRWAIGDPELASRLRAASRFDTGTCGSADGSHPVGGAVASAPTSVAGSAS